MRLPWLRKGFRHCWGTYHPPENTHGRKAFQVQILRTVGEGTSPSQRHSDRRPGDRAFSESSNLSKHVSRCPHFRALIAILIWATQHSCVRILGFARMYAKSLAVGRRSLVRTSSRVTNVCTRSAFAQSALGTMSKSPRHSRRFHRTPLV